MDEIHKLISDAVDYSSPGNEQASSVVKALKEKSLLKTDTFTSEMQQTVANEIDRYHQLLATGYCYSTLDTIIAKLLNSWNVIGAPDASEETTQV